MKEMKALLTAVKAELQSRLKYNIRKDDVFITPHVDYIPAAAKMPCIGIKDGRVLRKELAGGEMEYTLHIRIAVFVQNHKGIEYVILGDDPSNRDGVLDIEEDIHEILDENLLGIARMEDAFCTESAESDMVGRDKDLLQQKIITYEYLQKGDRP